MQPRTANYPGQAIPAGRSYQIFELKFVPIALLKRIRVKQAEGTPGAFTVRVYNSRKAAPQGELSVSEGYEDVMDNDLHEVVTPFAGTSGGIATYEPTGNDGAVYRNMDSTVANPQYRIYVGIFAAQNTAWDITIDYLQRGNGGSA